MKQTNISIFIPHLGCPNMCSFCNQRYISGTEKPPSPNEVFALLSEQVDILRAAERTAEIAFFGGSFTAIERDYMVRLLEIAQHFVKQFPQVYNGIRCSTRPDCIDEEIVALLKQYNMTAIELGAQSMDEQVLRLNNRGHSAADVIAASQLIKQNNISLGLQMMTGLYGDTPQKCIATAEKFIDIKPDTVRIYPTVIIKNTLLDELHSAGKYSSFSLEETVDLCAELLQMFEQNNIAVIRVGLHASENIQKEMTGGVYHPAFRELCESRIFYRQILEKFTALGGNRFVIFTDKKYISKIIGQNSGNKKALDKQGFSFAVKQENGTKLRIERI